MRRTLVLLLVGSIVPVGCDAVLGIDDHQLASDGGTESGSGSGSSSGSGSGSSSGGSSGSSSGSGSSGSSSGSGGGGDASGCSPNAQQCVGTGIATCSANGEWGTPWPCATGACSSGACTGSTSGSTNNSCSPGGAGMTTCPAGTGTESCCTSLEVPGGTFFRTYDLGPCPGGSCTDAGDSTPVPVDGGTPADSATVSGFRLDKYMVTVGRFRQFATAWNAGYTPGPASGKHAHLNGGQGLANSGGGAGYEPGWVVSDNDNVSPTTGNLDCYASFGTWTDQPGNNENLPINCVLWPEAYAFCIWDGGFLPSEAEWEYVAAGGSQQREYPWGSADPGTTNQYAIYDGCYPSSACGGQVSNYGNYAPVGTPPHGAALWGQLDMAGEARQWVLDWSAPFANPCVDCGDMTSGSARIHKGGAFNYPKWYMLSPTRDSDPPTARLALAGFRCARTP